MRSERKGRPQQVSCYRAGVEPGGLDLVERRASCSFAGSNLLSWPIVVWGVCRECLLALAIGRVGSVGERKCEESWSKEVEAEKKGRLNQVVW